MSGSRVSGSEIGWGILTLLAALIGAPLPWWTALGAVIAAAISWGLAARGRSSLSAATLAVGAAPLWFQAAIGPGWGPGFALLALLLGGVALARGPRLPPALALAALAIPLIEALRLLLVGDELLPARELVVSLLLGGIAVSGALAAAPAGGGGAGGLGLAGLLLASMALWVSGQPIEDPAAVRRAIGYGVESAHVLEIAADPALAATALRARPRWHAVGLRLLDHGSAAEALAAGWDPLGAHLWEADRVALALALDEAGNGGAAVRLLRQGQGPTLGWWEGLLLRHQGRALVWDPSGEVPAGIPIAPGVVSEPLLMASNGVARRPFHASAPLTAMTLRVRGQAYQGPPEIRFSIDGTELLTAPIQEGTATLDIAVQLAEGPHELELRFENDLSGPLGDRNAWLDEISIR